VGHSVAPDVCLPRKQAQAKRKRMRRPASKKAGEFKADRFGQFSYTMEHYGERGGKRSSSTRGLRGGKSRLRKEGNDLKKKKRRGRGKREWEIKNEEKLERVEALKGGKTKKIKGEEKKKKSRARVKGLNS